jgi:hypothetical protein
LFSRSERKSCTAVPSTKKPSRASLVALAEGLSCQGQQIEMCASW